MRISRLCKRLRRWSSQAFRKRHSPAAFRTCRKAGNSVLIVEGTTSKGTGTISCEVEFCIFYRLSLRTLRTKDVYILFDRGTVEVSSNKKEHLRIFLKPYVHTYMGTWKNAGLVVVDRRTVLL
jgi:hypothetical protein